MDTIIWMFLPVFVAAGSALLSFYIMQARMEVAIAKERESLAEARATILSTKSMMEERVKATEADTRGKSLDEFMREFRVEERSYLRETKSMFANKKLMVLQERLYFRNIPLSNWVEHEMLIEEGTDAQQIAKSCSVFSSKPIPEENRATVGRLLQEAGDSKAILRSLM